MGFRVNVHRRRMLPVSIALLLILVAPTLAEESEGATPVNGVTSDRLTTGRLAAERLFWQSVRDSKDPADFQAYLEKYPNGKFEALARIRLGRLKPSAESIEAGLYLGRSERRLIQLGLSAEGFHPGPADGLFGRRTRSAIAHWQKSRGMAATGYLNAETAKFLRESKSKPKAPERLPQRAGSPTPRGKGEGLSAAVTSPPKMHESRNAEKSLSEALSAAQGIESAFLRVSAFATIAEAQAAAGNLWDAEKSFSEALATAREIEATPLRDSAYAGIARRQAAVGDMPDAMATAQKITDAFWRATAYTNIAKAQAVAGNAQGAANFFSKAVEAAQRIDPWVRASVFANIAKAQAVAGNARGVAVFFTKALEAAQRAEDAIERAYAYGFIAEAQAAAGNVQEALRTAWGIQDGTPRASAFARIAQAQAAAGNVRDAEKSFSEALATAQGIEDGFFSFRDSVFADIAKAQAVAGNVQDALRTARGIQDGTPRASAFIDIAEAQAAAGNVQEALRTAWGIQDGKPRASAFARIAQVQAAAGNVEDALKTAQGIEGGFSRASTFAAIAKRQAENDALRTNAPIDHEQVENPGVETPATWTAVAKQESEEGRSQQGNPLRATESRNSEPSDAPPEGCKPLMDQLERDIQAVTQAMENYIIRTTGQYGLDDLGACGSIIVGYHANWNYAAALRRCPEGDPAGEQLAAVESQVEYMSNAADQLCASGFSGQRHYSMEELLDRLKNLTPLDQWSQ